MAKMCASTVPSAWHRADRLKRYESLKNPLGRAGFLFPLRQGMSGAAGALSSSAFVLPALKAKGWEERADGTAALSVLLLQDPQS